MSDDPPVPNWYEHDGLRPIPPWNPDDQLDAVTTALVVIDVQYGNASPDHGIGKRMRDEGRSEVGHERFTRVATRVVPNVNRLAEAFRQRESLVVYLTINSLRHDFRDIPRNRRRLAGWRHGGTGMTDLSAPPKEHQILDDLGPRGDDVVLNKTTIGAFTSSNLPSVLRSAGIQTMVVSGVSTNSCIESTVRGAADMGFRVVIAEDACGAAMQAFHEEAIATMNGQFAAVAPTTEILAALSPIEQLHDSRAERGLHA